MKGIGRLLRIGLRDLRGARRHLAVFFWCLMIGIAAMTAVGLTLHAASEGIRRDATTLAGGDLIVRTLYKPLGEEARTYIKEQGALSSHVALRTMASNPKGRQLVELKAVDNAYPLIGSVGLEPSIPLSEALRTDGTIYGGVAEPLLFDQLGIKPGDTISIGQLTVALRAKLLREPDRLSGTYNLGPRMMISEEALTASGLLQYGSLASYRVTVKLNKNTDANTIKSTIIEKYDDGSYEVTFAEDAAPGVSRAIDRLGLFLSFAALLSCLIGGIGIANAVRAYFAARAISIARLKCMGATNRQIMSIYLFQVLLMSVIGIGAGLIAGTVGHYLLLSQFGSLFPVPPVPGFDPVVALITASFGIVLSLAASLPWLFHARRTSPATLLRNAFSRELKLKFSKTEYAFFVLLAIMLVVLTIAYTKNIEFSFFFLGCTLLSFACFLAAAYFIRKIATLLASHKHRAFFSPLWRLSIANLGRKGGITAIFLSSFGLGVTMLVALALVASNFQLQLTYQRPEQAPSFFLLDVPPESSATLRDQLLALKGVDDVEMMPMLRGRITELNGKPPVIQKINPGVRWVLSNDRGISFSAKPPANAVITEGAWWPEDYKGKPLVSFGDDLAKRLGLKIGDTITINVAGTNVTATISNLRNIDWSTLQMNFSVVLSPGAIQGLPVSELATVRAKAENEADVLRFLAASYPQVTAVYLKETLAEAARLFESVTWVILGVAALSIIMGILVILSALRAVLERRVHESVILAVIGQPKTAIKSMLRREMTLLTFVTVGFSLLCGIVIASQIVDRMFLPQFFIPWEILVVAAVMAFGFALFIVYLFAREFMAIRPLALLRNE